MATISVTGFATWRDYAVTLAGLACREFTAIHPVTLVCGADVSPWPANGEGCLDERLAFHAKQKLLIVELGYLPFAYSRVCSPPLGIHLA